MTFEEANETAKDKDDVMEKFGIKYAYTICDNCVYGNGSFNCIGRMVTIFRVVGECRFFKNKTAEEKQI